LSIAIVFFQSLRRRGPAYACRYFMILATTPA